MEGAGARVGVHLGTGRESLAALGPRSERCRMRRLIYGTLCVIVVTALAGCAAGGLAAGSGGGSPGGSLSESYSNALPVVTQLIVGTFKLEETDLAISADQAQELVPLWQAYRTLLSSETSAQQEREALVSQIEESMTADQLKGIADMELTASDMQTIFSERGGPGGDDGTPSPNGAQTGQPGAGGGLIVPFDGGGGAFPGGGGGLSGGGSGFGGLAPGQTPNPEAFATLRAQRGGTSSLNPGLVNVLIRFLQQKAGGAPAPAPNGG